MDVVGMVGRGVGRVLSQGMYSVATPFHPFGGAVDIIVVEQPDGSYRSTPWYVRFGKFQGVLKRNEKVVTIAVNGVDASFHMLLDNSGQAYFMRELVPGGEDSETAAEEATSEPETPLRSKSDGELYSQLVGPELNEDQEVQNGEEFDSYGYSKLEEAEDLANQAGGGGGNSEMLLVSVNGCVLTAPISSTEENMEDVQLSDPQFHLGPGESSSGDLSRGGEVWESGILDGLYISQEKVKFDSEHPSEALEELREVSILKDGSHDIPVNAHESLHVSVNEGQTCVALTNALDVSVNNDDAYQPLTNEDKTCDIPLVQSNCVALTNEDEVQSVSRSENNGLNYQPLVMEDGVHEVSGNNGEGYQPFPNKDEALDVSVNNDDAYQPLTNEDETCDIPLVQSNEACKSPSMAGKVCDANNEIIEDEVKGLSQSGNNGPDYQTLNVEDEANDISGSNAEVDPILPNKEESLDILENNDEGSQPLTNEDETSDIPLVQNNEACKSPSKAGKVCDASNWIIEDEVQGLSQSGNNGPNYQMLNVEDEANDISGSNAEVDPLLPNKEVSLDILENNDEGSQPLTNEDEVQNDEACESPSKSDEICDESNENIQASFSRFDTFRSCLDLTSQDDGDSGTELFSPEFDHQRDSELSLSIRSDIDIDLGEDRSETAHCDQSNQLKHIEEVDVSSVTSDDNITRSEDCSPVYGKAADLSCEGGSDERRKDTTPSNIGACKSDRLRMSPSSDRDKLGSIPENPTAEEEINKEEHPQLQKGLGFEISLCGHLLRPGMGQTSADEVFQQHLVPEEDFKLSGPSIIKNANLIVRIGCNYFTWSKVSHVVLGKAVFGPDFCVEPIDAIPVERQETPNSRDDSLGLSPSRRWRLWPIPFRISRSLQRSNSDSSEDIFLDTETVLSPMDEQAPANNKDQSPRKQFVRTLIPTSEQVASLNLKEGQNIVTFSFCTRVFGKQQVDAHIYVWKWNAKIVISDVDGTITRSDVLGQVMPLVGRDWSQSGVARLFSAIKENGYQLIFLSARAIVQAYLTKNFLFNLKQDGKVMPNGPVVISPDGLFPSLYREVIRRAPHEFKIACLEDIKALFPSDYNPFYAGFGNRDTDELTYKKMGISKGKIFIINPKGEVAINSSVDVKSYTSLHTLVNDMFPPTTLVEQEDYNSWNYWKVPLPDIDL
ncbi:phosphatidate phosphatase PAH1 [Triticum urartu]|uniref:phosphatidate phosphatase n=1 Tax=Triticum urartu TaxID=4572 RepID=A0A8R7K1U0_TRIUA|nr:phosphatidate phosphatase PAH1 [Triticum urartu]XP_048541913.1 phosphatidate phosphatase PAH1 [Triticum urartu]